MSSSLMAEVKGHRDVYRCPAPVMQLLDTVVSYRGIRAESM